jgi:hypothetical protein
MPDTQPYNEQVISVSGVIPQLGSRADINTLRTEAGIGALMPWAGRLWFISYVSGGPGSGAGTGLYAIDDNFRMQKHPESVVGTYANRLIHAPSNQLVIGPHLIDVEGQVRTIRGVQDYLLTATFEHLHDPANMVYFLSMYGEMLEVNVHTLETKLLFDLGKELGIPTERLEQEPRPRAGYHFKGGHTSNGRVVVANNSYYEEEFEGKVATGRLAEWDGTHWTVLEEKPFNEIAGRKNMGEVIFATGWDRASAILKVFAKGQWRRYRLPKASHCFDHYWQTEWPRIREIETERYMMDCHGMFYELSPVAYTGKVWGVRPISTHLRIVPDYCSWRGFLVLAGNQVTPIDDNNLLAGEPQAGLWFGKSDDLWQFGKPQGWGGPWWESVVSAGEASDPYLMTGFDKKVLHLAHEADQSVRFTLEVDFLGTQAWKQYDRLAVPPGGYVHHEFPAGFSAHWVRVTSDQDCTATAYFTYT